MFFEIEKHLKSEFSSITNSLLAIVLGSIALLVLKNVIQRSKFGKKIPPGPIGLPILGYLPFIGSEPHKTFLKLSKKYGDIIGLYLGTNFTVILNEYSVMKEVYSQPESLDRATEQFTHISELGFASANGKAWQEQRKFTMSTIKDLGVGKNYFEEVISEEVSKFLEYLKNLGGKPTDISECLQFSITSNMISFLIGRKLDWTKDADDIRLSNSFSRSIFAKSGTGTAAVNIPGLSKLYQFFGVFGYGKAARNIRDFTAFMRKEIENHRNPSAPLESRDFVNMYKQELDKHEKSSSVQYFSDKMMLGNTIVLFAGGSDTTFSSIVWILRLMTDHKDVQDKVYAEVMKVLGPNGKAKYEERDLIPYTFAVLMEAQRYSGFSSMPACRKAVKDIQIKDFTIPKGSNITANFWAMHNDPNYWKEPRKFNPERFLSDNGTKLIKNPPSFAPFSLGRRSCPGATIAWMQILNYFTEIIKYFEVSTAPGVETDYTVKKGLLLTLYPQPLCFTPRKENI